MIDRALVTGGSGFLGSYMTRLLAESGVEVASADLHSAPVRRFQDLPTVARIQLDVTDQDAVTRAVGKMRPDVIFHFAGQAYIDKSWEDPIHTYLVNTRGTLHLLEAIRRHSPSTALAYAGSGTEYGRPEVVPTPESAPLLPGTPYASSKAAADLLCLQYFLGAGVRSYRYRIFGTTGPGKTGDACNDFALQIARAERGEAPAEVRVGNLDKRRDIMDVRDAVRAMLLVVERGEPGGAYNIGAGHPREVREILAELVGLATVPLRTVREESRVRPVDEPIHSGDVTKLRGLGFAPKIEFAQTLRDILDAWRAMGPSPVAPAGPIAPRAPVLVEPPLRGSV